MRGGCVPNGLAGTSAGVRGGCTWGGMGTGGYGEGLYRVPTDLWKAEPQTAKRAPEAPARGWSGWSEVQRPPGSQNPPFGPGRSSQLALPGSGTLPASWPIGARFDLISKKHSQNGEVSPKSVQKACHSPYFQNGLRKSPLGFLRFPFSPAFSHKELMGLF